MLLHRPGYTPRPKLGNYYKMPVSEKIEILRHLCDDVAESDAFRSEVNRRTSTTDVASTYCITEGLVGEEGADSNDYECGLCKMEGDLICCDGCPAAYHSRCVGVVRSQVAEGDWYCPECAIHKDKPWEKMGKCIRGAELLGTDPLGRRYYSSFGYLLVSECCNDEYSFWFYKRNDLPNLIEALESSPLPCANIISAITKQWDITHASISDDTQMNLISSAKYGYESSEVSRGAHYVNLYQLARTAAAFSEKLTAKLPEEATDSAEVIIAVQLKIITNRSAEFSWPNVESPNESLKKEKCGWCIYCKAPEDERDCLFVMRESFPAVDNFSSEVLDIRTRKTRKNHLIDVICHIICIEDHLKGLLSGPWLNPRYSELWRNSALEADNVGSVQDLLLELESNLHRRALSAGWNKHVDSFTSMGLASHTVGSTKRVSLKNGTEVRKRKCSKLEITKSSEASSGLSSFSWRGGKTSRELFNWKVLPRSLAAKAARQGGCKNISGVQYTYKGNAKRMKYTAWRAAVEQSRSVEQLAFQVREFDANIRWDDIGDSHFLEKMGKKSKKSIRSFKNAIIQKKCCERKVVRYLLDFGKRRSIPNIVMRHGSALEDSLNNRKKYWLDESHVPLHLLKAFEEKRIARKSNKVIPEKIIESKPLQKKGFQYLFEKAERFENYQCGYCNEDVPIREAVTCQNCQGFFHVKYARKGKPESSRHEKPSKELKTSRSGKGKKIKNKEKSEKKTKVPLVAPLRHSSRSSERFSLLMQSLKPKRRKRAEQAKQEEHDLKKLNIRRKKRTPVYSSYCSNGVRLSRRINDERLVQFRSKMLLVVYGEETSIKPNCSLCGEQEHKSNLNYVACEICRVWFHADALGLEGEKIRSIIGFKCHHCLHKRTPTCPHHSPTVSNKNEPFSANNAEKECNDSSMPKSGRKRKNYSVELGRTERSKRKRGV